MKSATLRESMQEMKGQLNTVIARAKADLASFFEAHPPHVPRNESLLILQKQGRQRLERIAAQIARRKSMRAKQYEKYRADVASAVQRVKERAAEEMKKVSPHDAIHGAKSLVVHGAKPHH